MTKKTNTALLHDAAVALEKQAAELAKLKASTRGERLRKAETEVKNAAKPKTRGGKLIEAERQVKAAKPRDPRLVWRDTV